MHTPHLQTEAERQSMADQALAGRPGAERAIDRREARQTVDVVDRAFAQGRLDIEARARRQVVSENRRIEAERASVRRIAQAAE